MKLVNKFGLDELNETYDKAETEVAVEVDLKNSEEAMKKSRILTFRLEN